MLLTIPLLRNNTVAWLNRKDGQRLAGRQDGVVAVEFIVLFPLFMLFLLGIMEFGHAFYVRHTLTNASREGARAAVMYRGGTAAERIAWAESTEVGSAIDTVTQYLTSRLPGVKWTIQNPVVAASGSSAAGTSGSTVTVRIEATDVTLVLGALVDTLQHLKVSGQTTMKME
jgi:Flp pilus assembly protein TadG